MCTMLSLTRIRPALINIYIYYTQIYANVVRVILQLDYDQTPAGFVRVILHIYYAKSYTDLVRVIFLL